MGILRLRGLLGLLFLFMYTASRGIENQEAFQSVSCIVPVFVWYIYAYTYILGCRQNEAPGTSGPFPLPLGLLLPLDFTFLLMSR